MQIYLDKHTMEDNGSPKCNGKHFPQRKRKNKLLHTVKAIMYAYLSSFSFIICSVALAISVDIHLFTASIKIQ